MIHRDLRSFISELESKGLLVRISEEVDPCEEITIIQHRVLAERGPALLFQNVKGSNYPVVTNLFGTRERVELAFGRPPTEIGSQLVSLFHRLMPPTLSNIWNERGTIWKVMRTGFSEKSRGAVLDRIDNKPDLNTLPCLKCWPLDGGYFFTLPLIHTIDPETGIGNLGIYRMQRFDSTSTGMHWQIEKGGGFHFAKAVRLGRTLPVSVILGGPPALTLSAIAPLPEGIDERILASFIMGEPLQTIRRPSGHRIPASSEFVLEGTVTKGDTRREGPFGDHLGHYSHSADFPVFRVERILSRKNAIYPATVVGKPPQEDYFIGEALQELTIPLLKLMKPGIKDFWAYPETGFHPLAVLSVSERYPHEALKHAFSVLGEGQLSLTKVLIVVDQDVNVRNFEEVSKSVFRYFDPKDSLYIISPSAQDTLDFTGPKMNEGSKLIVMALRRDEIRKNAPKDLPGGIHKDILKLHRLGEGFLMAQVSDKSELHSLREALARNEITSKFPFQVLVSQDVPMADSMLMLWGWFTRFDPERDIYPASIRVEGNRLLMNTPIMVDARWKEGYRKPVEFDQEKVKEVEKKWNRYGIK